MSFDQAPPEYSTAFVADDMSASPIPYVVLRDNGETWFLAVEFDDHTFYVTTVEWWPGCGQHFLELNGNRHVLTPVDPDDTDLQQGFQ